MDEQTTRTGKPHYPVLDGLRGTAALLVVMFHLMESVTADQSANLLRHGYLAVDFFFALSGYVMGYAYDDRWSRQSLASFFKARLIRLHPVIVVGVVLGAISYFIDPFPAVAHTPSLAAALTALVAGLLLLPSWTLPDRGTDYFPYNGVFWTLFLEYLANVAYAVVLRFVSTRILAMLVAAAAALLVWRAAVYDTLHLGYDWHTWDMAPVRIAYPFLAGLLLYRTRRAGASMRLGWAPLSVLLLIGFAIPHLTAAGGVSWNGLYDAGIVILLFPAIIAAGAHPVASKMWTSVCEQLGRLSYPLYGTHYALIYVYADWIKAASPDRGAIIAVGIVTWLVAVLIGWAAVQFWDEPIRRALRPRNPPPVAV